MCVKEKKAKGVFTQWIMEWGWKNHLKHRIMSTMFNVDYILHQCHHAYNSRKRRFHVLENEIWEEELLRMCDILTGPESTVKQQGLWKDHICKLQKPEK